MTVKELDYLGLVGSGVGLMAFGVGFFTQTIDTPMWVLLVAFFVPTSEIQSILLRLVERLNTKLGPPDNDNGDSNK